MWVAITIGALLILFAAAVFGFLAYAGGRFLKNIRRSSGGQFAMRNVDISFYENGPLKPAAQKGLEYMKALPFEEITVKAFDGIALYGRCYPAPAGGNKFVIGMHGFKSHSLTEFAPYIQFYHSLGYGMILPDERANRKSGGEYSGMGVLERLDCISWAEYAIEKYGGDAELLLHGVSMGAAAVCCASGEKLPPQVKGIISDCAFSSIWDETEFQTRNIIGRPMPLLLKYCERRCKRLAGYDFRSISALEQVKKAKIPMLFVHGEKDSMVPAEMAKRLYDACSSKKLLLTVPGADHAESIAVAPEKYHEAVITLLKSCNR